MICVRMVSFVTCLFAGDVEVLIMLSLLVFVRIAVLNNKMDGRG